MHIIDNVIPFLAGGRLLLLPDALMLDSAKVLSHLGAHGCTYMARAGAGPSQSPSNRLL